MSNTHPLKQYRSQRGLSQSAVAKVLGVTQGMVWRWEKGIEGITADRAVSIEEKTGSDLPAETLSTTIQRYEELKTRRRWTRKGGKHATNL